MTNDDAGSGARTARTGTTDLEGCLDRPRDPLPTRVDLSPPLPAAYHDALDDGLRHLRLELDATDRTAIDGHVRLLLAWNGAINLTAIRDPAAIAIRHVIDSLTAVAILRDRGIDRFVDLGSGGGYPGIPLAIALPAAQALLVESIGKKARFLATAAEALGMADRIIVRAQRLEDLAAEPGTRGRWPALTARAVGPLADLVELGVPLLRPRGVLVAWKSGDPDDAAGLGAEIAAAWRALRAIDPGGRIEILPVVAGPVSDDLAVLADHRLIVVVRGRAAVAPSWPRNPAARRRAPW